MTDNSQQIAYGTGIAQAYGEGATATVNIIGFNPEQINSLLQAAGAAAQAKIDELAGQLRTSSEAVRGFLRILKEDEGPIEQLPGKLTLIAQRYVGMLERLAALDPEDADAQVYIDEAREVLHWATSTKDYDRADALLSKAEDAQDRSLRRAEALEREAHDAASRIRHGKAATRAERGELSLTRLDYLQAAQHFQSAASLVGGGDLNLKLGYLTRSADALLTYGDEKGNNATLTEAIDLYREILSQRTQQNTPLEWAITQNNLGNALATLGERESGTGKLEEALTACRAALTEYTREQVPLEWAATQNNLGTALGAVGKRESGTGRLEEAVMAFREALTEFTRDRVPLAWAATQNNLGIALLSLGNRESATGQLEEAVAAFREALKEQTRERVSLEWAATQNNLGLALLSLGERETGTGRLEEAVAAFREALTEFTRERVPLGWAMAQKNLGDALGMLGDRESGTARLEAAVAAFREALEERTRERVPVQWAATQKNLGIALLSLGERERGISRLEEAREAIEFAWRGYQEMGMRQYDDWFEARLKAVNDLITSRC